MTTSKGPMRSPTSPRSSDLNGTYGGSSGEEPAHQTRCVGGNRHLKFNSAAATSARPPRLSGRAGTSPLLFPRPSDLQTLRAGAQNDIGSQSTGTAQHRTEARPLRFNDFRGFLCELRRTNMDISSALSAPLYTYGLLQKLEKSAGDGNGGNDISSCGLILLSGPRQCLSLAHPRRAGRLPLLQNLGSPSSW